MSGNNGSMLKAAGLWAKSSVKGGQYLTGRLGGVKVLENRDRKSDDDPSHHLFFVEVPPRQGAQERGDGQRGAHNGRDTSGRSETIHASPLQLPGACWRRGGLVGAVVARWCGAQSGAGRRG